jgi:hypothetical protein
LSWGKSYDVAEPQASGYFADLMQLVLGWRIAIDFSQPWHDIGPVFGDPRLAPYRPSWPRPAPWSPRPSHRPAATCCSTRSPIRWHGGPARRW